MDTIGGFRLSNEGGFVCAGRVKYLDLDTGGEGVSDRWHYINLGQSEMMMGKELLEKGVPANSLIQMYIDIVAGNDRTGGMWFHWDISSRAYGDYRVSGTTLNSGVHFEGIKK